VQIADFGLRHAADLAELIGPANVAALEVSLPGAHVGQLLGLAQQLAGVSQLLLHQLALGDVDQGHERAEIHPGRRVLDRLRRGHYPCDLAACELAAQGHRGLGAAGLQRAFGGMLARRERRAVRVEHARRELADRLALQLTARESEQTQRLGVGIGDRTVTAQLHDAARERLEEAERHDSVHSFPR